MCAIPHHLFPPLDLTHRGVLHFPVWDCFSRFLSCVSIKVVFNGLQDTAIAIMLRAGRTESAACADSAGGLCGCRCAGWFRILLVERANGGEGKWPRAGWVLHPHWQCTTLLPESSRMLYTQPCAGVGGAQMLPAVGVSAFGAIDDAQPALWLLYEGSAAGASPACG